MPNPSNGRIVWIDVYIETIKPLKFNVVQSPCNDPQLPETPTRQIIFSNDHHNGFEIHFRLMGDTKGYFFPPNSQKLDAVWSQAGSVCPQTKRINKIFRPIRVVEPLPPHQNERRELIVHNQNPSPSEGVFQYNLRVTNGTDILDLDPGGDNQNGPLSFQKGFPVLAFVLGVAAGAVAVLGAQVLLRG